MNTRNRIGYRDWHIAIILFNFAWTDDKPYGQNWLYLLQITQDDGDGSCLFRYMKCDEGGGYFTTYIDLFWISMVRV
jgi:hypothetical protein